MMVVCDDCRTSLTTYTRGGVRGIRRGLPSQGEAHRRALRDEAGQGIIFYAWLSEPLTVGIKMRKTDMLRKGQEGHVRAEREVLKAAALAGSSRGADWLVRLHYRQVKSFTP
jgi:hypothetical protein